MASFLIVSITHSYHIQHSSSFHVYDNGIYNQWERYWAVTSNKEWHQHSSAGTTATQVNNILPWGAVSAAGLSPRHWFGTFLPRYPCRWRAKAVGNSPFLERLLAERCCWPKPWTLDCKCRRRIALYTEGSRKGINQSRMSRSFSVSGSIPIMFAQGKVWHRPLLWCFDGMRIRKSWYCQVLAITVYCTVASISKGRISPAQCRHQWRLCTLPPAGETSSHCE